MDHEPRIMDQEPLIIQLSVRLAIAKLKTISNHDILENNCETCDAHVYFICSSGSGFDFIVLDTSQEVSSLALRRCTGRYIRHGIADMQGMGRRAP